MKISAKEVPVFTFSFSLPGGGSPLPLAPVSYATGKWFSHFWRRYGETKWKTWSL